METKKSNGINQYDFFCCFEVGFLFLRHNNLNMLWSQAPLKASENQINHFYVWIRVYG